MTDWNHKFNSLAHIIYHINYIYKKNVNIVNHVLQTINIYTTGNECFENNTIPDVY